MDSERALSPEEEFDPSFPGRVQERVRRLLGTTWDEILAADVRARQARPPNPKRHILALLDENASRFSLEEVAASYPGRLPDLLALTAIANILERSRSFDAFEGMAASMVSPKDFRHHMLTLGLADHIRTHTPYQVRIPVGQESGQRIVDLVISHPDGQEMEVETQTRDEFDGPRQEVTPANALGAISRAWKKKVSGDRAQLGRLGPGLLLLGGLTLKVESLSVIQRMAERWLALRGRGHPTIWGIAALTYWTYTLGPPPRPSPEGRPAEVHARAGVQLRAAENPYYTGHLRIALSPYAHEPP